MGRSAVFEGEEKIRASFVRDDHIEARVDGSTTPVAGSAGQVDVAYRVEPGPTVDFEILGLSRGDRRRLEKRLSAASNSCSGTRTTREA